MTIGVRPRIPVKQFDLVAALILGYLDDFALSERQGGMVDDQPADLDDYLLGLNLD